MYILDYRKKTSGNLANQRKQNDDVMNYVIGSHQ